MTRRILLGSIALALVLSVFFAPYLDCYGRTYFNLPEMIELGGYELAMVSCGSKKPAAIIEPGLAVRKENYYDLQRRIFPHAKTITYDHAGVGDSSRNDNPRTLPYYVEELRALFAAEEIDPPYILIGHSLGGHIVRYYAHLYPEEVLALVFLDHPHEDWFRHIRANWTTEEQNEYFKWWTPEITSPDQVSLIERLEYDNNNDLVRGKTIPTDIPVLMFTGDNAPHFRKDPAGKAEDMRVWAELQHSLIEEVDDAKQIVDWETGHMLHRDKPQKVAEEIIEFIERVNLAL